MPFLLHCRQFAFLKGIWEPWHHQNEGLLVALLPFLFICNCWLLFQSSFLFPAWTLALDCTRMLIFQLQWLFQFFWLSSPLGLTHPPAAVVPWQLILHFSPVSRRPVGQESTHHPLLVGSMWMEPGLAHGRREQHCSLHVDYTLSSISFSSGLASMVNGFLQKAKYQWGQDGAVLLGMLLRAS